MGDGIADYKDQYCREYNVLVCFQLNICFSLAFEQLTINIQSLLLIKIIPEINYNHINVNIVMRIYQGNEVAVCSPVTISSPITPKNYKVHQSAEHALSYIKMPPRLHNDIVKIIHETIHT